MDEYNVTGMSCASCVAHVQKAVAKLPDVDEVEVNLLTNSMTVSGSASPEEVISAVEGAGYGASLSRSEGAKENAGKDAQELNALDFGDPSAVQRKETAGMIRRLVWSLIWLVLLIYFSMGVSMWGWPVPAFLSAPLQIGMLQMLLAVIIIGLNRKFFISGFKSMAHGAPNMDSLVALGSGVSFGYSLWQLFLMAGGYGGNRLASLYFDSSAMILALITVGKTLESYSKGRTTDAIRGLMDLAPKKATVIRDGKEITIDASRIRADEIFLVRPGESVPVDGVILEGSTAVDESALTGEPVPADKTVGDEISLGTINTYGSIRCRATRVGSDTTLAQIIEMVREASASKAPIAQMADRVAGVFVPVVFVIAAVTAIAWALSGAPAADVINHAIAVLVISCPCALGLATPVAIMVGNGVAAKSGILFKTASSLEETGRARTVVLDKTGTVTAGHPAVTGLYPAENVSAGHLLEIAYALEKKSEHPLAAAIVDFAETQGLDPESGRAPRSAWEQAQEKAQKKEVSEDLQRRKTAGEYVNENRFGFLPAGEKYDKTLEALDFVGSAGNGLSAKIGGLACYAGKYDFILQQMDADAAAAADAFCRDMQIDGQRKGGKTPLFFSEGGDFLGVITVADPIKPDSTRAISLLKSQGMHVVMLTGDSRDTAEFIAKEAGCDDVIAEVLPDEKAARISELQKRDQVLMVGDGINDAPALTQADVGLAIGAGTDIAIDAADVVLERGSLMDVANAVRLSRLVLRNIRENLFWAFCYNVIGIPLAAGALTPLTGWTLSPMFGAAAMSVSSFLVVMNALRLNLAKVYDADGKLFRPKKVSEKTTPAFEPSVETEDGPKAASGNTEEKSMKTLKIEGMMCEHCEQHVHDALVALDGVESAKVSHESGTAEVELSGSVSDADFAKAVSDAGYQLKGIA